MRALPTYYYLSHFHEFLKFVTGPCATLLDDDDRLFLQKFMHLSQAAQCLIVRFINRKSIFVKPKSYQYEEIENIPANFDLLFTQAWFKPLSPNYVIDFIEHLTKAEIIQLIDELNAAYFPVDGPTDRYSEKVPTKKVPTKKVLTKKAPRLEYKKSHSKAQLIECLVSGAQATDICNTNIAKEYWQGNFEDAINYFLYLYFGNFHAKLNQFSMRDLGLMRTRKEQAQVRARFADIESAKSTFALHSQYHEVKKQFSLIKQQASTLHKLETNSTSVTGQNQKSAKHLYILEQLTYIPEAKGAKAFEIEAKLRFLLANELLSEDDSSAIALLKNINTDSAQEKWVREAYKKGYRQEVETELEHIIQTPLSESLLAFAEDFLARKFHKKRTSILTDMLRQNSQTIAIDEMHKGAVEKGVLAYYKSQNYLALHTENEIWRSLFGLYFWHEIFDLDGLGLSNEFEHVPTSLKTNQFYAIATKQIEGRLASTTSKPKLIQQITQSAAKHYGKGNILFRWRKNLLERLNLLINHTELDSLLALLKAMTQDWHNLSDGFPDLMVIQEKALRFEEVKSEGDQLRRNQLLSIQKLKSLGFDVRITNVNWIIDPMQAYAVVDIETTGGRAQHHRITEVGIVKVVGGEIVAQWQSLINPQRRIPQNITALTGIDNDLVSRAPLFAEVADDIEAFTEGCVFVAHNVNFDYGFIKQEFSRLDRHYRRPKLCTVREMRKHYKGLPSYSLAQLSKHFGINMQRHHRAMSDALAASELLNMINEKRISYD